MGGARFFVAVSRAFMQDRSYALRPQRIARATADVSAVGASKA